MPTAPFRPNSVAPFRVRILDPQQTGYEHTGKRGWAQPGSTTGGRTVEITLDDGSVVYGYQCWWEREPVVDILGTYEVAELLGVSPQVVSNWLRRHDDFPRPYVRLKMSPVWYNQREELEKWFSKRHPR